MSDEEIMFADWDKIILKNARSRDSKELGNVIAVDDENIISRYIGATQFSLD